PMLYYQDQIDLWVQERNAETDPGMIKMADELIRELQILNAEFQKVMFAYLVRGVGLTLKAKFAWAVLLPDATHPGKFRYQSFNETGFTGHSTADTAEEVVLEMFKDGYREVDDDVLERLSVSETW